MRKLLPVKGIFCAAAMGGCLIAGLITPDIAEARVKLITLPVRERVEIQLDNASATLVEEERIVPLVKGENQVDFSWANTQIDPNTIVFRVVAPVGEKMLDVKVLSVSYPPNEAALIWTVGSSDSGSARVRISYLLGNLSKSFNYRAIASKDETSLTLSQYMRLQNFANESFGSSGLWAGFGKRFLKPIGLNETKEMLMEKFEKVPIKKTYTVNVAEFGWLDQPQQKLRVPMHYVLKNNKANNLGVAPLQYGKVRIFIDGGQDGSTAFLGEDWGKFTPIDDEMKLYLGVAQDVVVKRTIEKNENKKQGGNVSHQEVILKYEIENFKDKEVTLDVIENLRHVRNEVRGDTGRDVEWELGKETTFEGGIDKEKSTFEQVVFHAKLPAKGADGKAKKITHKLHVTLKNEWQ
ncbi:MAG TPA: hypothetical protein VFB96_04470 [Pirellulaceae bacterium]|nr:hypothetical protein [Pirellulaceae bacterium]